MPKKKITKEELDQLLSDANENTDSDGRPPVNWVLLIFIAIIGVVIAVNTPAPGEQQLNNLLERTVGEKK